MLKTKLFNINGGLLLGTFCSIAVYELAKILAGIFLMEKIFFIRIQRIDMKYRLAITVNFFNACKIHISYLLNQARGPYWENIGSRS